MFGCFMVWRGANSGNKGKDGEAAPSPAHNVEKTVFLLLLSKKKKNGISDFVFPCFPYNQ